MHESQCLHRILSRGCRLLVLSLRSISCLLKLSSPPAPLFRSLLPLLLLSSLLSSLLPLLLLSSLLSSLLSPSPPSLSSKSCYECPSLGRRAGCQRGPRPVHPIPDSPLPISEELLDGMGGRKYGCRHSPAECAMRAAKKSLPLIEACACAMPWMRCRGGCRLRARLEAATCLFQRVIYRTTDLERLPATVHLQIGINTTTEGAELAHTHIILFLRTYPQPLFSQRYHRLPISSFLFLSLLGYSDPVATSTTYRTLDSQVGDTNTTPFL